MRRKLWPLVYAVGSWAIIIGGVVFVIFILSGCAVGRGPTGEVIWGWKVGVLAETGEQALGAAFDTFAPGFGGLVATLLGSTGLAAAGTAWINRHVAKTSAEAAQLRGREEGWNQAVLEGAARPAGVVPVARESEE